MTSIAGRVIVAVLLFGAGALSLAEARFTRRLADAHLRLATLHLDGSEELDRGNELLKRVSLPVVPSEDEVQRHKATVTYWLSRYESLTDMTSRTASAPADPYLLFIAANAAYRSSAPQSQDRRGVVERLDGVIQAYADVLRKDSTYTDAAFNYEFVAKLRDSLARAPANRSAKKPAAVAKDTGGDLPAGPTVHGRPGGPPEGTDMSDFKTITPMRYDEREEQIDPGRGRTLPRKG